jgi:hypothetical protein
LLNRGGKLPKYIKDLVLAWVEKHETEFYKSLVRIGGIGRRTEGDCDNRYQQVKGNCYNTQQQVEGGCFNTGQEVKGNCFNDHQQVKGDCYNDRQQVKGFCCNNHQQVKGEIYIQYTRNNDIEIDEFIKKLSDEHGGSLTWKQLVRLAMKGKEKNDPKD